VASPAPCHRRGRHEQICADLVGLLDALGERQAVFVGHDWGGAIVWAMALHYPERVRVVAGVNTPFAPAGPVNLLEARTAGI
jgi:pimeloyl-ACP methyl ester carboxylesterase